MSKKIIREIRTCACGCGEQFECKINSARKYSKVGHNAKIAGFNNFKIGIKLTSLHKIKISKKLKGIKHTEEHNKKVSKALIGRKLSIEHKKHLRGKIRIITQITRDKISKANKGKKMPAWTIERKIKISKFNEKTGHKRHYLRGYYISKNNISHYYASSYELRRMKFLDICDISFQKNHIHTIIWYDDDNKSHAYTPDLLVGNILEEIKPEYKLNDRDVILKAQYAKEYCKNNNLEYRFITEKDLESV